MPINFIYQFSTGPSQNQKEKEYTQFEVNAQKLMDKQNQLKVYIIYNILI